MGRGIKGIALFIVLVIILVSCQKADKAAPSKEEQSSPQGIVIGVSLASSDSPYLKSVSEYMISEARTQGVTLLLKYAQWDAEVQAQQLNEFRKQKVDAIIFCPVNAKSMLTPLKKIKEAQIPVINLNMRVDAISAVYVDSYVGASNEEEASLAAEMVVEMLGEQGGAIGIIEGAPGSDAQIYRTQTFVEQLTAYPQIQIIALGEGGWNRNMAQLAGWDMLKKYPDLQVIYCHDSNMAMGVIAAVEELGLQGKVRIIGISESPEYIKAVQDERLYGFVTQPPEYEGRTSVEKAVAAANGKILQAWYKNPIQIVTKDNVKN